MPVMPAVDAMNGLRGMCGMRGTRTRRPVRGTHAMHAMPALPLKLGHDVMSGCIAMQVITSNPAQCSRVLLTVRLLLKGAGARRV